MNQEPKRQFIQIKICARKRFSHESMIQTKQDQMREPQTKNGGSNIHYNNQ